MFNQLDSRILDFDFSKLIDFNFIFEKAPSGFYFHDWFIVSTLVNILLGMVLMWVVKAKFGEIKPKLKFLNKILTIHIINWIIFGIVVLLRGVDFAIYPRFLMFVSIVFQIGIEAYALYYWMKIMPKRLEQYENARSRDKYLPRKKK